MPDHNDSSTDLRRRIAHHRHLRADAEGARAVMLDARPNALITVTDEELAEFDGEMARLARAVDRADAHLALIQPALAEADRVTIASVAGAFGGGAAAVVSMTLKAAALPVRPISPKILGDPPTPRVARDDLAWWAERHAKERAERARRLRATSGEPTPADR